MDVVPQESVQYHAVHSIPSGRERGDIAGCWEGFGETVHGGSSVGELGGDAGGVSRGDISWGE